MTQTPVRARRPDAASALLGPVVAQPPDRSDRVVRAFAVVFVGYPVWWLLGIASVLPLGVAALMLWDLGSRRDVPVPRGWTLWALFLAWVGAGVLLLGVDAPGGVPGGLDASRLLVYAYRAAWYGAATIALLWFYGTSSRRMSFQRVCALLAPLFVVTTVGGVAGIVLADVDFPSLLEALMPSSLTHNGFVRELVHPGLADVQQVLGRDEARPKAPFPFTNTWGSCLALLLPFFVVAWWSHGRRWQRWATPVVLATAAVPVAFSLNRGLWICLIAGWLVLVVVAFVHGHPSLLLTSAMVLVVALVGFAATPLGDLVGERLDNPHSNARRSSLAVETVHSAAQGSPVVGFGSTRDVQGNFASLAGASTPDCPECGAPPLGTQGQLWMLIFSEGFVGTGLFLAFLAVVLSRTWRCRTEVETVGTLVLVFFGIQIFVYDTFALPLFLVMVTVGVVLREQRETGREPVVRTLGQWVAHGRSAAAPLLALTVVGAGLGVGLALARPVQQAARVDVLLPHTPVYLPPYEPPEKNPPDDVTIDSAAAALEADPTVGSAFDRATRSSGQVADRVRVTAAPNTRVLQVTVVGDSAAQARAAAGALVEAFLNSQSQALARRRDRVLQYAPPSSYAFQAALTQVPDPGTVLHTSPPEPLPRGLTVFGVSGAALGLLAATVLVVLRPGWFGGRRRRRRG